MFILVRIQKKFTLRMFLGEVDNLEKLLYYKEWNNSLLLINNTIRSCSKELKDVGWGEMERGRILFEMEFGRRWERRDDRVRQQKFNSGGTTEGNLSRWLYPPLLSACCSSPAVIRSPLIQGDRLLSSRKILETESWREIDINI